MSDYMDRDDNSIGAVEVLVGLLAGALAVALYRKIAERNPGSSSEVDYMSDTSGDTTSHSDDLLVGSKDATKSMKSSTSAPNCKRPASSRSRVVKQRRNEILEFLEEAGQVNARVLYRKFPDVHPRTIRRDLNYLVDIGAVKRVGLTNDTEFKFVKRVDG